MFSQTRYMQKIGGGSGVLDLYPARFAFAFEKLASDVVNVARIERDSDNTQSDFTSAQIYNGTLASWVGAGNNGYVVKLYDQTGNAHHYNISALVNKIIDNGVLLTDNGKAYMTFDGNYNGNIYNYDSFPMLNGSNGSVFTIMNSSDGTGGVIGTAGGSSFFGVTRFGLNNTPHQRIGSPKYYANSVEVTNPTYNNLAVSWITGSDVIASMLDLEFSVSNGNWLVGFFYNNYNNTGFVNAMKFKVCITYNADQTANRAAIETNIRNIYSF